MFVEDQASLVVRSVTLSVDQITEALGLEPTRVVRRGEPTSARTGVNTTYPHSAWILTVDEPNGTGGEQVAALRRLLEIVGGRGEMVGRLRTEAEIEVRWSGYSESSQGGFVMPFDVISGVAALGCDLIGTVWLGDAREDTRTD